MNVIFQIPYSLIVDFLNIFPFIPLWLCKNFCRESCILIPLFSAEILSSPVAQWQSVRLPTMGSRVQIPAGDTQKFHKKKFYRVGFYILVIWGPQGVYFEVWRVFLLANYFLFKSVLAWCVRARWGSMNKISFRRIAHATFLGFF